MTRVRRNHPGPVSDQDGFTLVELLVALALVSLMATAILGGIDISRRIWQTGPEREFHAEIEAAAETLRTRLAQTIPAVAPGDDGLARLVFQGGPHDLVIVTLSDGRSQVGGMALTQIAFAAQKADGGATPPVGQIRISSTVFRAETAFAAMPADATTAVLFHDAISFDLAYFGVVTPGHSPEWQDRWLGRDQLPELVAIRMVLRDSREAMSLTIPVRIPTAP
jgi:prepilin-type N-terminal cleavage/methylation domain-containing protein